MVRRQVIIWEVVLAFGLPTLVLLYGFAVSLLALLGGEFLVAAAFLGMASAGVAGLYGVWALTMAVADNTPKISSPVWVLVSTFAGVLAWVVVLGGPVGKGDPIVLHILFWAPLIVLAQLLAQNWGRLRNAV